MTVGVVIDESGSVVMETKVPTTEISILSLVDSIAGTVHVAFEEGAQAQWLHDLLVPRVASVTVCRGLPPRPNKGDVIDAEELSRRLRLGELKPTYHRWAGNLRTLRHIERAYHVGVTDTVRTMLRLRALFRAVAVPAESRSLYNVKRRDQWIALLPEDGLRIRAGFLYDTLETLRRVRSRARLAMFREARQHAAWNLLLSHPLVGPIRASQLIAIIGTPYRFRTKRQLWSYGGLAVRTHTSSEYAMNGGRIVRARQPMTRGLTREFNRPLKRLLKSMATELGCRPGPYGDWYRARLAEGMEPSMAKLALARKVASVLLTLWKKGETFDPQILIRESKPT